MNTTAQFHDVATPILASKEFFERSTRVLEEADSEFCPREEMMTVAQQVAHTALTIDWFIDGVSRPEGFNLDFASQRKAMQAVTSLTAARQMLEAAYDRATEFFRSRTAEELARPLPPGPIMGGTPLAEVIGHIADHTAHHRGALTVYSRLLGKTPLMPYGE